MLLQKLRERVGARLRGEESGFTLVELLVVMLILGLLAAIAIPSFFNQRDKAKDADAKAATRTAQTSIETYATDNDGSYANVTVANLRTIEPTLNDANITAVSSTANSYSVTVAAEDTGNTFTISRASTGLLDSDCTVRGQDGCPQNGNWAAENDPAP